MISKGEGEDWSEDRLALVHKEKPRPENIVDYSGFLVGILLDLAVFFQGCRDTCS